MNSGSQTVSSNIHCGKFRCGFSYEIMAQAPVVSDDIAPVSSCASGVAIPLAPNGAVVFPLFTLDQSGSAEAPYSGVYAYQKMGSVDPSSPIQVIVTGEQLGMGIVLNVSGGLSTIDVGEEEVQIFTVISGIAINQDSTAFLKSLLQTYSNSATNSDNYLILTNPSQDASIGVCLEFPQPLPRPTIFVQAKGFVGSREVSLQALKKVALPSFLYQTYTQIGQ